MKSIIKTLSLTFMLFCGVIAKVQAETIETVNKQKSFALEGGGFPLVGTSSLFSGNLNIKFGFNMEKATFLLSAKQIHYLDGPIAYSYKEPNGNTIVKPVSQIYEKKLEFQVQERYYPLRKNGLIQPFITVGLGFELPSQSNWLPIPIPVILGNIGTDIMINDSVGINLILNASFPRGLTPEINLKLDF